MRLSVAQLILLVFLSIPQHAYSMGSAREGTSAASPFSKMVVFGDSMSDNGNLQRLSRALTFGFYPIPDPKYYWNGRFSNGPVWSDFVSKWLELPLENHAYGGSMTSIRARSIGLRTPAMLNEVDMYLLKHQPWPQVNKKFGEILWVLFIGANNYINKDTRPELAVSDIMKATKLLTDRGARWIVVVNVPDLGEVPKILTDRKYDPETMGRLSLRHNELLRERVSEFEAKHQDVNILLYDVASVLEEVKRSPASFGLDDVRNPCYSGSYYPGLSFKRNPASEMAVSSHGAIESADGSVPTILDTVEALKDLESQMLGASSKNAAPTVCETPDTRLYWDYFHPTTKAQCFLAGYLVQQLVEKRFFPSTTGNYIDQCR